MEDLTDIHKCDCGRPFCQYFAPGNGDYGRSFSEESLREVLVQCERNIEAINKVLKEPVKKNGA